MSELLKSVVFNSFWIAGLALLLATLSYGYDKAQREKLSMRILLQTFPFSALNWLGLALISTGLALTSEPFWEIGVWVIITIVSLISAITAWRDNAKPDPSQN